MRRRFPLVFVLGAAFLLKLALLVHFDTHPLLQPVGEMDSGVYARLSSEVARGDLLLRMPGPVPFFVSPLYVYFLAALHTLSAASLFAVKAVQIALGTVAVGLVWGAARRLVDERAALAAAILFALTGDVSFHEILVLQAALDPFLTALFLYLLAVALEKNGWKIWLAAGAALGLFALNRPNVLPFAAVVCLGLLLRSPFKANLRVSIPLAAAFLAGVAALVALPFARNLVVSGEPVVISSHGGLNFLVGNGPGATGVYRWLEGITPSVSGQSADAKKVAEREAGRALTTREVSSHFARAALSWIAKEPGAAARLFLRKIWYVFSNDEMSLNFSVSWYRRESALLRLLFVGPWLLVPLGILGLVFAHLGKGRLPARAAAVWFSFVPVYALLVAAFFVATRYRLPLAVPLAVGAGGAVSLVWSALAAGDRKALLLAAGVVAPCLLVALWPTGVDDGSTEEETQWALHLIDIGDVAESTARLSAVAKKSPLPGVVWFRAGQAWLAEGGLDEAVKALEHAREVDPAQTETRAVLAVARERRGMENAVAGNTAAAIPDLEEAARLDPKNAVVRLNLAVLVAQTGDRARAASLAREALALQPGYAKAAAFLDALGRQK